MPRTAFAGSLLDGASNGLGRLAQSIAMGQRSYQDGFDQESTLQSRLAQAIAAQQRAQADVQESTEKTRGLQLTNERLAQLPQLADDQAAIGAGVSVPMVKAFRDSLRNGTTPKIPGAQPLDGPNLDGSAGVAPIIPPEVQSRIGMELRRALPVLLNDGKLPAGDWAKALDTFSDTDLRNDVLAGRRTAGDVGRAQAAQTGKALFSSGSDGQVLDLFAGGVNVDNPVAQAGLGYKAAQTGAQKANTAQSYAAARHSDASARKADAEARDGVNRGGAKAPTGYRWGADGTTLEPIPGGPADPATKGAKLAKPPTEGQAKALLFGSRMQVAHDILNELADSGIDQPSIAKRAMERIPGVGGALGMAANSFATPQQQQVEQAQRDFINAVLRRESGAAIADSEFANARQQYFPQPGDSAAVKRQKAINRQTAIAGQKAEFGEQSLPQFNEIVGAARASRKAKPGEQPPSENRTVTVDF